MEFTTSQKATIQNQFDCFCKRVVKYQARDRYDADKRQRKHEVSFEMLSMKEIGRLYTLDKPTYNDTTFEVLGRQIVVSNSHIAEAIKELPKRKRDIILMHYFLDMTDGQIGACLGIVRRTVQYQRTSALKELHRLLGDDRIDLHEET